MPSAFSAVLSNLAYDRHFGGSSESIVADPYISGYHYIHWAKLPAELATFVPTGDGQLAQGQLGGTDQIGVFLQGACLSVTPPGGTLNKTEFTGIGGLKWAVPTNMDYTNTVTVKFLEFSHLPVLSIISGWFRLIRDAKTGVSALNSGPDIYTKSSYAGSMFYWTTKPDGVTVEFSALYTGMFPSKDPQDLFAGDLTAVDKLEIDIEFNVDWTWHETWVHDKCQGYADQIKAQNDPRGGYRGSLTGPGSGTDSENK
jgi:hypothetical protein